MIVDPLVKANMFRGEVIPFRTVLERGASAERKEVSVPAAVMAVYAGDYELAPAFGLKVTLEDGKLWTQATGQPRIRLYAASDAVFFLREVEAEVEFVKDASGKATALLLRQNGVERKAPRVK